VLLGDVQTIGRHGQPERGQRERGVRIERALVVPNGFAESPLTIRRLSAEVCLERRQRRCLVRAEALAFSGVRREKPYRELIDHRQQAIGRALNCLVRADRSVCDTNERCRHENTRGTSDDAADHHGLRGEALRHSHRFRVRTALCVGETRTTPATQHEARVDRRSREIITQSHRE